MTTTPVKTMLTVAVCFVQCLVYSQTTAEELGDDPIVQLAGISHGGGAKADHGSQCRSCSEPWVVSREPIFCSSHLDCLTDLGSSIGDGCNFSMPITGGAWHWFHQSLIGNSGGYGIDNLRGTYFWYLYADPVIDHGNGRKVGGHAELRLREVDPFRGFIDDQVWLWEAYAYIEGENGGKLKAGQLYRQFSLFWDGVFFGNAAYFDGQKLDADYGLSWEKTTEFDDCFKVDSYVQFFFHEDQSNGSFPGADPESVVNYTERNTGVVRLVPTWTRDDGSVVALGLSGQIGQIDSRTPALADQSLSGYAVDLTYTRGPWKWFIEGSQLFGILNPTRYVSGGPSNRLTNALAGVHYTCGPATLRCSYSASVDANPRAMQNMILAGATITLTKHVDLYIEYVNQRVDGADDPTRNGDFFNSFEWVIGWHF